MPLRCYLIRATGKLVHVDIKNLGRLRDGGGHRVLGRAADLRNNRQDGGLGCAYLHHAIDSYSRVVYSEILENERKETAAGFCFRADAFFASIGVVATAIMIDNSSCYRSHLFAAALSETIWYRCTRPYRPQTNGKVERFNRTMLAEWAHATTYQSEEDR